MQHASCNSFLGSFPLAVQAISDGVSDTIQVSSCKRWATVLILGADNIESWLSSCGHEGRPSPLLEWSDGIVLNGLLPPSWRLVVAAVTLNVSRWLPNLLICLTSGYVLPARYPFDMDWPLLRYGLAS